MSENQKKSSKNQGTPRIWYHRCGTRWAHRVPLMRSNRDDLLSIYSSVQRSSWKVGVHTGFQRWVSLTSVKPKVHKSFNSLAGGLVFRGKKVGITHTLKRSSATEPVPPKYLPILETLNIFGVQASYMDDFQRFLEIGDPPEIYIPFHIPIKPDTQLLSHNLVIPYIDKSGFKKERPLKLSIDTPPHTRSVEVDSHAPCPVT